MATKKVGLSAPWYIYYRKVMAMFGGDSEITIIYDDEKKNITMYVRNSAKADAIAAMLPSEVTFGKIKLTITIKPANDVAAIKKVAPKANVFEDAFASNPVFCKAVTIEGLTSSPITYVIFKKEVVQIWTDDLGDANGVCSTLYQEIAKELFEDTVEGAYYCTDVGKDNKVILGQKFGKPLGEWP